jgi:hypothetical protein
MAAGSIGMGLQDGDASHDAQRRSVGSMALDEFCQANVCRNTLIFASYP